jgi:hypothetical protein
MGWCAFLVPAMTLAACTTALYPGPRRPDNAIAAIGSRETRINYVDHKWVRDFWVGANARYELLPGVHSIGISLERNTNYFLFNKLQYSKTVTLCLDAEAGHRYRTVPVISGETWAPRIIDEGNGDSVGEGCGFVRSPIGHPPASPSADPMPLAPSEGASPPDAE